MLALEESEFASPAIKTALIPNTNMDPAEHKHWKLLTNMCMDKPYACTNKQCTQHKRIQQIESWLASHSFFMTNLKMITGAWESICSLKRKNVNIQLYFQKDTGINVLSI